MRDILTPRGPYLAPLLLLVVARLLAWIALPAASEDAYITFRYARHLANGFGLVYNPGERVFGFSSPVWTVWTALGCALSLDPVWWTRGTTLVADLLTLLLVGGMLERDVAEGGTRARIPAWAFTFFFAAWPFFSAASASGMENSAMLALIGLAALTARRGSAAAGPLLGLLSLWRPEGIACAAVIALGARPRDRIVAGVLLAAGVAALTVYFGSPVPQSVIAKASIYGTPGPWAGRFWWGWAMPLRLPGMFESGEARQLSALSVLIAPALVAGIPVLWRVRTRALACFVGACLIVWLGYAAVGVAYFYWYLVVPLAGALALAAVGLPRLLRGWPVFAAIALLTLTSWHEAYPLYVGRAQNEYNAFAQAAEFLRTYARPGEKVMLEPIGMIGFRCPVVVVDEVGLVSPAVARRRRQGPGWYTDVAAAESPQWIVVRHGAIRSGTAFAGRGAPFRSPAERDSLLARYELATRIDEISGDAALVVLYRVRP